MIAIATQKNVRMMEITSGVTNVGAQTRRTENVIWHPEDLLEIHPYDAEERGVVDGGWVALASRAGETELRAHITDTVPQGVVYTTFHHPVTGANVVTTEHSDWATNCPEYKVTAVQVRARVHATPAPQSPGLRSDRVSSDVPALR